MNKQIEKLAREIELRRRAEIELIEQREWLRVTLAGIGDGVIATDTHGIITFLNPVAETHTGWLRAEALGQPVERIFFGSSMMPRAARSKIRCDAFWRTGSSSVSPTIHC